MGYPRYYKELTPQTSLKVAYIKQDASHKAKSVRDWYSVDPLAIKGGHLSGNSNTGGVFDPANNNPYSYVHNNPVIYSDPDENDIIIRLYDTATKQYKEYARIKFAIYFNSINIDLPYPMMLVSRAADDSKQRVYGNKVTGQSEYPFDKMVRLAGEPDAVAVSIGGNLAFFNKGYGVSYSIALMLKGIDAGKVGSYSTSNNLKGLESSIGLQVSLMYSDVPLRDFNMNTLEGYAEGYQGGVSYFGASYLQYSKVSLLS
ncbi:MAG: hypothetical protein C4K58_08020 [Flavobacteriaceae bacterium]|nr:MAG: hypothetical protein C4K58_08020 [Flavobacteriaceae bacterium]